MPAAALESGPEARPFLRWAGGKTQLLPELVKRVPPKFGTYHEPFLGGGALFFHLAPKQAMLYDNNEPLIETYAAIKCAPNDVIRWLTGPALDDSRETYLDIREQFNGRRCNSPSTLAAWFIYLNKTCFNGLWRVNRDGNFNVSYDDTRRGKRLICDASNLRAVGGALRTATLHASGFERILVHARKGDFVYFDPPYVPKSDTANFTGYTKGGFSMDDQTKLRDVALALKKRGVHVLLSNSDTPAVRKLYAQGFVIESVMARRNINSKGAGRGKVGEVLIR